MKKQRLTSAIRNKLQCSDQANAYSVNKKEMLDLIKEKMLNTLSDEEKKRLSKPFPAFKGCSIQKENKFEYLSWTNPNRLFGHNKVLLFTDLNVYELSIPWLGANSFKKGLKELLT